MKNFHSRTGDGWWGVSFLLALGISTLGSHWPLPAPCTPPALAVTLPFLPTLSPPLKSLEHCHAHHFLWYWQNLMSVQLCGKGLKPRDAWLMWSPAQTPAWQPVWHCPVLTEALICLKSICTVLFKVFPSHIRSNESVPYCLLGVCERSLRNMHTYFALGS